MENNYKRLTLAIYASNVSTSITSALQPLLFITLRQMYGISYSLLGLLVVINFCSQLSVDLIFSFFSHKFNIEKCVKAMPIVATIGYIFYALSPLVFVGCEYIGLVIGTIIYSVSSGLAEVLSSRVIAAIPSPNPERAMSKLHSTFAWGVVGVVLFSTVFMKIFGSSSWQILTLILTLVPITSIILFIGQPMPYMPETEDKKSNSSKKLLCWEFVLSVVCIFLGGASENIMSQWSSGYIERALNIPKIYGDIFGVAMFSVMLGIGRTLYAKFGKNITLVLCICSVSSFICYIVASICNNAIIAIIACGLTGIATSMLWPGNLIAVSPKFASAGVAMFALMAAGGDLGASIGPQLMGIITDSAMGSEKIMEFAIMQNITVEQMAMKIGLLSMSIFPFLCIFACLILHIIQLKRKKSQQKTTLD